MKVKEGAILISNFDGQSYRIEKIIGEMALIKSKDGHKEMLISFKDLDKFYREDASLEEGNERRKTPRYLVKGEVTASIHNGRMIVGTIKEMNMEGLCFEYLRLKNQITEDDKGFKWKLYLLLDDFMLSGIPCEVLYDVSALPSNRNDLLSKDSRRCGIRFQTLSPDQKLLVQSFLETYCEPGGQEESL